MLMSGRCEEQETCIIILEGGDKNETPSFMNRQIQFVKDINVIKSLYEHDFSN